MINDNTMLNFDYLAWGYEIINQKQVTIDIIDR